MRTEEAGRNDGLEEAIAKAKAAYAAMSPLDRAIHDLEQKRSFVRGMAEDAPLEVIDKHLAERPEYVVLDELKRLRQSTPFPSEPTDAGVRELAEKLKEYAATEHGKRFRIHADIMQLIFSDPAALADALRRLASSHPTSGGMTAKDWLDFANAPTSERDDAQDEVPAFRNPRYP